MIVAEVESSKFGTISVAKDADGVYNVTCNGVVTQPDHDAEGVIRFLANILQNT